MFDLNLKDKVILITGGSDGLGFASAKLLSQQGAKVALCGRRGDYLKEKANIIREETKNDVPLSLLATRSISHGGRARRMGRREPRAERRPLRAARPWPALRPRDSGLSCRQISL